MSPEEIELKRREIVREARDWLGTNYHHLGDIKGVGVDCAMLLVKIYKSVGIVPDDYDPRPYEPEWYLHRDEERYLAGMDKFSRRISLSNVDLGDILLYRFGRTASHGAIYIGNDLMIHAYKLHGNVELCELRVHAHRLDSCWSVFA